MIRIKGRAALRLTILVLALVLIAAPAIACVPEGAAQNPAGPDVNLASKVIKGLQGVTGRPTTIPGSMGGAVNIADVGADSGGVAGGGAGGGTLTNPVDFTDAGGTTKGTIADVAGGGKKITVDAGGTTRFDGGRFSSDNEGRVLDPADAPGAGTFKGGVITLGPGVVIEIDPATGRVKFSGCNGKITGQTEGRIDGGRPSNAGATLGSVGPGKARLDSNQVYGED